MKNIYIILISILFTFTSCQTNKGVVHFKDVVNKQVMTDELYADMEIDSNTKLSGTSKSTYFLCFRIKGDNGYSDVLGTWASLFSFGAGSAIKLAATYNALEGTDADFLARPTYKMTTKNYILFSTMEATVEGYKGKYTNFREVNTFERELEIAKKKGVLQQVKIKKKL